MHLKYCTIFVLCQQDQEQEQEHKSVLTGSASRGGEGLVRTLDDGNSPETETLLPLQEHSRSFCEVSRRFSGEYFS